MDQIGRAGAYGNMGSFVRDQGDAAGSLERFDKAIQILVPLYKQSTPAQRFLRNKYAGSAIAYHMLGEYDKALTDWDRAIELSPAAVEQSELRIMKAGSQAKAGAVEEAIVELEKSIQNPLPNAACSYNAACAYAIAFGNRPDQQEYAAQAMTYLHSAVALGLRGAQRLRSDSDLAPLREREDFQNLLIDMEAMPAP